MNLFTKALAVSTLLMSSISTAAIIPTGIVTNINANSIVNDGWTQIYRENVGLTSSISSVFGGLASDDLIYIAGIRNSDNNVMAGAATTWGEFSTYTSLNTTHDSNGVSWYYNGYSMGFTALNDSINQTSADTSIFVNGYQGLSIHTNYISGSHGQSTSNFQDYNVTPTFFGSGYRAGSAYVGNGGTAYDWAFYTAAATNVPEPSILALMGLGIFGIAVSRRKIKK